MTTNIEVATAADALRVIRWMLDAPSRPSRVTVFGRYATVLDVAERLRMDHPASSRKDVPSAEAVIVTVRGTEFLCKSSSQPHHQNYTEDVVIRVNVEPSGGTVHVAIGAESIVSAIGERLDRMVAEKVEQVFADHAERLTAFFKGA